MRDFYAMVHSSTAESIHIQNTLYFSSYLAAVQEAARRILYHVDVIVNGSYDVPRAQSIIQDIKYGNYTLAMDEFNSAQTIHTFKIEKISVDMSEFSFGNIKENLFQEADYKIV